MPTKKGSTSPRRKSPSRASRQSAAINPDITIKDVADEVGKPLELVRDVLNEAAGAKVPLAVQDRIFSAARALGYDLRKLKIGKRMRVRRDTIIEILDQCKSNSAWNRAEIITYLERNLQMLDRVRRQVFHNEFDQPWV
jgi:hypothetical protein